MKKFLSVLTLIVFALCMMSAGVLADDRTVDPPSLDRWENWFGEGVNTSENAGGVWLDKTVQTDTSYYNEAITKNNTNLSIDDDNFLISLSAIGNNKSIMGYTYHPTDTFLVLDVSGSMNHDRITTLVAAANDAMKRLLELNNYNRVGVVLYSNTSTLLLPPDHYSHSNDTFLVYTAADSNGRRYVKVNSNVKDSAGNTMERKQRRGDNGSTYIQGALDLAYDEFAKLDIKIPDGEDFMAGMARTPIIVLMSDGAPTLASQHYDNLGASTFGNGDNSTNENSFVTQLTAADVRYKLDAHYQSTTPLFYTLGLNVENNSHAVSVMDPERTNSSINSYWNTFMAGRQVNLSGTNLSLTKSSDSNITDASQKLYVDRYFPAADKDDMLGAFTAIVDQIIIQSRYFATDVDGDANFDGYVTFIDDIGNYMEVKAMKGMVYGNTYYDGSCLAENFVSDSGGTEAFGTNANPTPLGNEFIWAIKERLGISNTATAQNLVDTAYHYGQLYYKSPTDFGNRISIYADENMHYLGFYNKGSNFPVPSGAKYIVDTYGFIDSTIAENSDDYQSLQGRLLYISVAVRTEISTGNVSVVWQIPATMLPMITRDFSIEGKDLSNPGKITMTDNLDSVYPLRLVYEVGLRDEINPFNVSDIVKEDTVGNSVKIHNGVYSFYTNKWNKDIVDDSANPDDLDNYPSLDVNTVAYFQPGEKNERYYYADSTIVYVECNQNEDGAVEAGNGKFYKPYDGLLHPSGDDYYHMLGIFNWQDADNIKYELHPEKIMTNALKEAEKSDDKWIIPAGTPRGRDSGGNGTLIVYKGDNATTPANHTNSLPYSHYGSYEYFHHADDNNETLFLVDCILGNNGVQTLTSAQGLAISKTVDVVPAGTTPKFEFTITSTNYTGTVTATLLKANGAYEQLPEVSFANGSATVTVGADETLYLTGMDVGTSFKVVEANHNEYIFSSVKMNGALSNTNEAHVSIAANELQKVEYYNVFDRTGELVIRKIVDFLDGDQYDIDNLMFTFDVVLDGYDDGDKISTTDGEKTVDADGKISVAVPADGSVMIYGLNDGTVASVTEREKTGFTSDLSDQNNKVTIESNHSKTITVTNTYEPILPDPGQNDYLLTLTGEKEMNGRKLLDTDSFDVAFGYHGSSDDGSMDHDHGIAVAQLDVATLDKTNEWKYDFSAKLNEHFASEVAKHGIGVYIYHIHEVIPADADKIPGVVYDPIVNDVEIHVTDTDLDGYYEVEVVPYRNAKADGLNITANVINTYAPAGYVTAEFLIEKELENLTDEDISLAGFRFGLFENGKAEPLYILVSDEHGGDSLYLNYTPEDIGIHEYVLKELIPEKGSADYKPRMIYDDTAYAITVEVYDKLDSTLGVKIYETDLGSANASDSFKGVFTNVYEDTVPVEAVFSIEKTVIDDQSEEKISPTGFAFGLYSADDPNGTPIVVSEKTLAAGKATIIMRVTKNDVGTTHYIVKEIIPEGEEKNEWITYDNTTYPLSVTVEEDADGKLQVYIYKTNEGNVIPADAGATFSGLAFTNHYFKPILNRDDHFAYIIGYPEDYKTGKATRDESLWPVKPMGHITRAEVATIFFRMLTDEARNNYWSRECSYTDIKSADWYYNAVCTLTKAKILNGNPDGTFAPNKPITRAEFAAIAGRFYNSECTCDTDHFSDIAGHWGQSEINHAACEDLIHGYPGTTEYRPDALITRAEAVTIVNRMLERVPEKNHLLGTDVMRIWPDNMDTDKWYYAEMQEATNSHTYDRITDVSTGNTIEQWKQMLPIRDWEALEKEWSDANSGKNDAGEVVK